MLRQKDAWALTQSSVEGALQSATTSSGQAFSAQAWQKPDTFARGSGGASSSTLQPTGRVNASKTRASSGVLIRGWTIHRANRFGHFSGQRVGCRGACLGRARGASLLATSLGASGSDSVTAASRTAL